MSIRVQGALGMRHIDLSGELSDSTSDLTYEMVVQVHAKSLVDVREQQERRGSLNEGSRSRESIPCHEQPGSFLS